MDSSGKHNFESPTKQSGKKRKEKKAQQNLLNFDGSAGLEGEIPGIR